jgi:ABC-2 type transport system ATP-binding protein
MVANRFLFIDGGKVLKEITKEELDRECAKCTVIKTEDAKYTATALEEKGITDYKVIDGSRIRIYDERISSGEINQYLAQKKILVSEIYETGISMEDYFKSLVEEV